MAYTNVWSDTFPADTEAANAIGANLRQLRLDLDERLTGFIVTDITADPLVLADAVAGKVTGATKVIPFPQFVNYVTPSGIGITDGYITVNASEPAYAPLAIPVGCTVTQLEWLVDRGTASGATGVLNKVTFDNTSTVSAVSATVIGAGFSVTTSAAFSEVIATGYQYYLKIVPVGGASKLYAVRITFDRDITAHAT